MCAHPHPSPQRHQPGENRFSGRNLKGDERRGGPDRFDVTPSAGPIPLKHQVGRIILSRSKGASQRGHPEQIEGLTPLCGVVIKGSKTDSDHGLLC